MSILSGIENLGKKAVNGLSDGVDKVESVAKGAASFASNEAQDLYKSGINATKDMIKVDSGLLHGLEIVGHQAELAGEGVVSGAILKPIGGLEQVVNKAAGTNLPVIELPNQREVDKSWAGKTGEIGGTAAAFIATDGAVGAATGLERGTLASGALAGALQGTFLTETDPSKKGLSFWADRLENGAVYSATASAVRGVKFHAQGADWFNNKTALARDLTIVGVSRVAGAATNEESKSLFKHGQLTDFQAP